MDAVSDASPIELALRHDRWITLATLALLVVACWWYLYVMAEGMRAMTGEGGSAEYMWLMPMGAWGPRELVLACAMWVIMMIGMMVPSAAPVVLLYALIRRRELRQNRVLPSTGVFLCGYLLVWSGFSLAAAGAQFGLTEVSLMSDLMESSSKLLSGAVLMLAGLYQVTPWKGRCLAHCRAPIVFLTRHWSAGPLRMGLLHGAYCLGCCWAVMCVLFAVGVMNLGWIAALSVVVLLEKTMPHGEWLARSSGALLVGAGLLVFMQPT